MLYIGTRKQRETLGDYLDDIDMGLVSATSPKLIEELTLLRKKIETVFRRGIGFINIPKEQYIYDIWE